MLIYFFAIASIPIYNMIFRNKKWFVFIVTLQLFLILAMRDIDMGVDLVQYFEHYKRLNNFSWDKIYPCLHIFSAADYPIGLESGYCILSWFCSYYGLSYHSFLVICAAISTLSLGLFIYRYSKIPYLSFMMYIGLSCYFTNFGILRQTLALSILLLTIPYIIKRRWIKVIIITFIAVSFHRVAFLWIILCFLYGKSVTHRKCLILLGCCLCLITLGPILTKILILPILSFFNKSVYLIGMDGIFKYNNLFLVLFIALVFITFFANMKIFKHPNNNLAFWGILIALMIETFALFNTIMARATELFYIFIIILIPNIINSFSLKSEIKQIMYKNSILLKLSVQVIIIVLMCILTYYFANNYHSDIKIIPYRFYVGDFL